MNPYPMKQPDAIAMLDAERAIADQLFRASQDARWLRETLAKAGDDTASGNPFSGFRVDKTQAEADAEIAAALQARIDGEATYMNANPFSPDEPAPQIPIPDHLRPRRVRTPEEVAEAKAAGKFAPPSPVALWLEPDAARLRAEARQKAAEEQRLRDSMSADAWTAAANFAASLGIAVAELMESFNRNLAPTFDAIRDLARDLGQFPPPSPTAPGAGLKALRKATNRKAHWLK